MELHPYGVDLRTWVTWNDRQKELWIQEYNRTDAQQNYATDLDWQTGTAYAYTGIVDSILGTEAVETGERVNETVDYVQDIPDRLDDIKDDAMLPLIGLGLLWIVTRKGQTRNYYVS